MKLFSNTRTKPKTAFVVLLMWLFALASGLANACLLEAHVSHSHVATAGYSGAAHASTLLTAHARAVAGHDHDSYTAEASNLKVCDDGSQ